MEILTAPFQLGTDNMGFSAHFPAKKRAREFTILFIILLIYNSPGIFHAILEVIWGLITKMNSSKIF